MAEYVWPAGMTLERQESISKLLWVLYRHGGEVAHEDGRALGVLLQLLADNGIEITGGYLNKTIGDLTQGGRFGPFIKREVSGKRTYAITLIRDPFQHPFPPDPYGEYGTEPETEKLPFEEPAVEAVTAGPVRDDTVEEEPIVATHAEDNEVEVEVADLDDLDDLIANAETAATAARSVPGTALDHLPEPGRTDKILYAISLLNDVLREDAERDVTTIVASQFAEFNRIAEENRELRDQNEKLRGDKVRLASALRQATAVMKTAAQNGTGVGARA